jgi:mono/diheme cytochrome c family protein
MYRGIIQYRTFITEYLRDHIVGHDLEQPTGLGRIYRVVHRTTRREARPALSGESSPQLVDRLAHPNGWWRDTAQRLLVERADLSVVPMLEDRVRRARLVRTRLHALWVLDGLDSTDPDLVERALVDRSPDVRAAAIRAAERWIVLPDHPLQDAVIARLDDQDAFVRRQLAATLGFLPAAKRTAALTRLLAEHGGDPITMDAALSGVAGAERALLAATPLTAARTGPRVSQPRVATRRVAPQPCPTCPGARGGPGGARAFPSTTGEGRTSPAGPLDTPAVAIHSAADEQERFLAGSTLFAAVCAVCHQEDGRGAGRIAPLVDSPLVAGPPAQMIRLVLDGRRSRSGFMPGLAGLLSDDDIANVVTFVRQQWGNATAVGPEIVQEVRANR